MGLYPEVWYRCPPDYWSRTDAVQRDDNIVTNNWDSGKQIGNDGGAPEAHLAPGQGVAKECGRHHQKKNDDAHYPEQFTRRFIRPVIKSSKDVDVDGSEKHRCARGMHISDQPPIIHVAHDVFDGIEGAAEGRNIMHREYDAAHDHDHQYDAGERSKIPQIVQIPWRRVFVQLVVQKSEDR